MKNYVNLCALLGVGLVPAFSVAATDDSIEAVRAEIRSMEAAYEKRIDDLESKLTKFDKGQDNGSVSSSNARRIYNNSFNPSIGLVLNGYYSNFSVDEAEIAGFGVGEEGERRGAGFTLGETELNFSANVDDKFFAHATAAIVNEDGENIVELEEAYVQSIAGLGLPDGLSVKAGRSFWTLGYLNEHHAHTDDFADRPLPYRVFLNKAYNDDGVEASYVLPTDFYAEIGGGAFRGDDFPFGGSDGKGLDAWSLFARVGGDIGDNQGWRVGASVLSGEAEGGRGSNEEAVTFTGDSDLYIADLRYTWAPTGNAREKEVIFQGEYFYRDEDGTYEDTDAGTGVVDFDESVNGWYAQLVYKFAQPWRVGVRYSELESASVPAGLVGSALDAAGHDATAYAAMVDWANSEFSRIRFQYSREELSDGEEDDQFVLQYTMSIGAHGAHKY